MSAPGFATRTHPSSNCFHSSKARTAARKHFRPFPILDRDRSWANPAGNFGFCRPAREPRNSSSSPRPQYSSTSRSTSAEVGLVILNISSVCQLQLQASRVVAHQRRDAVVLGVEVRCDRGGCRVIELREACTCIRLRHSIYLDGEEIPPRLKCA